MLDLRTHLRELLYDAEQAFTEIASLTTHSPKADEYERQAHEQLLKLRAEINRIENLLSNPNNQT